MSNKAKMNSAAAPRLAAVAGGVVMAGLASAAVAGPTIPVGDEGSLTINYELQIWSQYRDFRSQANDGAAYDTFLRRNRVTFTGQYNDYVGFYAQIEAGNDSKGGNDDRETFFRDAYLTFDWSDSLRFIAGRFKNTFSRENLEACFEPLSLDRGLISYTPFAGTRDTGYAVWGNLADASLQYRLMVADGRESDNVPKDSPRVTGRVHYSFLDPEYAYGYRGTYLGTQRVFTIGAAYDYQANAAYANLPGRTDVEDYTAWTADMFFEYPFNFGTVTMSGAIMEYSVGGASRVESPRLDTTLPVTADREGYYAKAGYLLPSRVGPGRLQLFARHERADHGRDDGLYDYDVNAVGFNYYLDGQQLKVTLEYAETSFDVQHSQLRALQDQKQATLGFQMLF